ncbi:MAG TPA: RagB/SusD family nutrient uptake outer membrane protein [Parafilimonas sp.]|nr:RagB/SusD family nutrient uptake outer membrane protein [Parafilimonas sp.]
MILLISNITKLTLCIGILICFFSCKKYLDEKTNKKLVVPSTLQDAQALLDNYKQLNLTYPSTGQESDDDHYLLDNNYNALSLVGQQVYTWDVNAQTYNDWSYLYGNVLYANLALETTENIKPDASNINSWKFTKGQALFFRAFSFFHIAEYFAIPYNATTASTELGIPLRMTSDVNEKTVRASLEETYRQITADLTAAASLLPETADPVSRPGKAAAFGALARVYLAMNNFVDAGLYADSCLLLHPVLIDYNKLDSTLPAPVNSFNEEVIFQCSTLQAFSIYSPIAKTDTLFYESYANTDLRKHIFFKRNPDGTHSFKGSYNGSYRYDIPFNGIATDEMYLIRAECSARAGAKDKALNDLNTLLQQRYQEGTFTPLTANNSEEALGLILKERRKELTGRNIRWFDLRRLNAEGKYSTLLTRKENGQIYNLPPNDPRYTFMVPPQVIEMSGIEQNVRQ